MHQYSAQSPVFQSLELTQNQPGMGPFVGPRAAGLAQNFCIRCHSPLVNADPANPENRYQTSQELSSTTLSSTTRDSIGCTYCHSVHGPDPRPVVAFGMTGNGIGNVAQLFQPTDRYTGPSPANDPPLASRFHAGGFQSTQQASLPTYLKSAQFCGACHDVRFAVPPAVLPIVQQELGENFLREQDLFSEWERSPYASATDPKNPQRKVVSCQDCHMSLYPTRPPGTYAQAQIAVGGRVRRHAHHSFTAASVALVNDPVRFPNQDTTEKDEFNFPKGQKQRREQMLRAACTLTATDTPRTIRPRSRFLPLRLTVTNTGAGHRVPSGFSQEREVWLEITVRNDRGQTLYQTGNLVDRPHPETGERQADGKVDDEDLQDVIVRINPLNFNVVSKRTGPDFNARPFGQIGLVNFRNIFWKQVAPKKSEEVFVQFRPHWMDNSRSLPPLEPVSIRYEIPLELSTHFDPNYRGRYHVATKLRYRSFPPKFLRTLAQQPGAGLVRESTVKLNTIVDMASIDTFTIAVAGEEQPPRSLDNCVRPLNSQALNAVAYSFFRPDSQRWWVAFYDKARYVTAKQQCEEIGYRLATTDDLNSLGLDTYDPKIGDNKEELWKEVWTNDIAERQPPAISMKTYHFLRGAGVEKFGRGRGDADARDSHYFKCVCGGS